MVFVAEPQQSAISVDPHIGQEAMIMCAVRQKFPAFCGCLAARPYFFYCEQDCIDFRLLFMRYAHLVSIEIVIILLIYGSFC